MSFMQKVHHLNEKLKNRCNHKLEKTTIFTDISFVSVIISRIVDGKK